jgi:ABC-type multidrug transport system fused ATPase/permease subunit
MPSDTLLTELTRTIQLAVAPVFLLTALGTLLSVLTTRLGRIVDRARVLDARRFEPHQVSELDAHNDELGTLSRRRYLINYAVTCATLAALQVCILIAGAFLGFMLHRNFSLFIAGMFIGAMAAFISALLFFLREILISVSRSRIHALPRA